MKLRPASLTWRVVTLTVGVAAVTVLIAVLAFWPLINRAADSVARASLGRTADLVAETLADDTETTYPYSGQVGGLQQRLQLLLIQQQAYGYIVFPSAQAQAPLQQSDVTAVTSGDSVSAKRRSGGELYFVEGRPVGDRFGVLLVQPATVASALAWGVIARLGLAMLLGIAVAVVIGAWVARRLTRPLVAAADAAREMSAGQRDIRVAPDGPAEVADIAVALNQLAAGLAESEGRQREFFLTVSHELRTPLTSLKGYSEALADGVVPDTDVPVVAAIMRSEADQLDRLVADLLDLARLGAVDVRVEPVPTDLAGLGREAAATWRGRAERDGVIFHAELPPGELLCSTDPIRVRQIIDNLMANAMRVTAAGQQVVLAIFPDPEPSPPDARDSWPAGASEAAASTLCVQVRDGGPGLTADDLRVAFEPGELHARYRGVRKVGTGVGLALVNRLAQRLGGWAQAGVAPEGGACFSVHLPVTGPLSLQAPNGTTEPPAGTPTMQPASPVGPATIG